MNLLWYCVNSAREGTSSIFRWRWAISRFLRACNLLIAIKLYSKRYSINRVTDSGILAKYLQNTYSILAKYLQYTYNIFTVYLQYTYSILTIYLQYTYSILTIYLQYTYNILTVYLQYTYNILTVYLHYTYNILTLYMYLPLKPLSFVALPDQSQGAA